MKCFLKYYENTPIHANILSKSENATLFYALSFKEVGIGILVLGCSSVRPFVTLFDA